MEVLFRPLADPDYSKLLSIYNRYILESTVSFRLEPVSPEMIRKIYPLHHPVYQTYVAEHQKQVIGYAAFGPYKEGKSAYDRTAEVSVYLSQDYLFRGVGKQALTTIESKARQRDIRVLLAFITAENRISVDFFTKQGYTFAGLLKQVGEKFGRVLDVVIYQKEL